MNNQYPEKEEGTQLAPDEAVGAALMLLAFVLVVGAVGIIAVESISYVITLYTSTP